MNIAVPAKHSIKIKENEKKIKYLDLVRELKKAVEHEWDNDTNCTLSIWNGAQG